MNIAEFGIIVYELVNSDDENEFSTDVLWKISRMVTDYDRFTDLGDFLPKVTWKEVKP